MPFILNLFFFSCFWNFFQTTPSDTSEPRLEHRVILRENKAVSVCGLGKDEARASRIMQNILLPPKFPSGFKYLTFRFITMLR